MSSGTITPAQPPPGKEGPTVPPVQESKLAVLIDRRLRTTRRQVKGSDIAVGLVTLAACALGFLFIAALADQWLVSGGLGFWGRLFLWAILLGALGWYFVKHVWPTIAYRINPIYAAQTIEQSKPTLKNSLINFLLLRGHRSELAPVIYQALEQRAATDLSRTPVEGTVDQRHLLRRGTVLAAIIILFCAYLVFSPKNPFVSVARLLWPWSSLHAPTRVTIEDIRPGGNSELFLGDHLEISAIVRGQRDDEPVLAHYSTVDGQIVDQAAPLKFSGGRYEVQLPPGDLGLQQDLTYWITAGDDHTEKYRVEVRIPPAITVERVDYRYPPYTGIADRSETQQGDLRGIEGTVVTVTAKANQPIARAWIDLNCEGKTSVLMDVKDRTAVGKFTLQIDPRDPERAKYTSYQILFTDRRDHTNRKPIRHRIDVLRDLPPEVKIIDPQKQETPVAEDGRVEIRVRAEDADFALRRVALAAAVDENPLDMPPLLQRKSPSPPHVGAFEGKYVFEPKQWGLKAGARVAYWAEADDNKEPEPGMTRTAPQFLVIVGPEKTPPENSREKSAPAAGKPQSDQTGKSDKNRAENPTPEKSNSQNPPEEQEQPKEEPGKTGQQPPGKKNPEKQENPNNSPEQSTTEKNSGNEGEKSSAKQGSQDAEKNAGIQGEKQPAENPQQPGQGEESGKDQTEKGDQSGKQSTEQGGQSNEQKTGEAGEKQGEPQAGQQPEQSRQPIDPEAQPGDAIQKILEHQREEQARNPENQPGKEEPSQNTANQSEQQPDAGKDREQKSETGNQEPNHKEQGSESKENKSQSGKESSTGDREQAGEQKTPGREEQGGSGKGGAEKNGGDQSKDKSPQTSEESSGGKSQDASEKSDREKKSSGGEPSPDKRTSAEQPDSGKSAPENKTTADESSTGEKNQGEKSTEGKKQTESTNPDENQGGSETRKGEEGKQEAKEPRGGEGEPKTGTKAPPQRQPKPGEAKQSPQDTGLTQRPPEPGESMPKPKGTPEPQGENQPKTELQPKTTGHQTESPDEGTSPTTSNKQSKTQSENSGDRSGEGKEGGGQKAPKPGQGGPGTQTPSDQGASQAQEHGQGETGNRPGQDAESRQPNGSPNKRTSEQGPSSKAQGSGNQEQGTGKDQTQNQGEPGRPQPGEGGAQGNQSNPTQPSNTAGPAGQGGASGPNSGKENPQTGASGQTDEANLEYSKKQTELALRHLDEELAKQKTDLLDQLGWTRAEAQRFIERWNQLRQEAKTPGAKGQDARKKLDGAIQSLGLRPRGTTIGRGDAKSDKHRELRDAGRFAPPDPWQEQFRAYSRGVAEEGKP